MKKNYLILILIIIVFTVAFMQADMDSPINPNTEPETEYQYILVSHESADEEMFKAISERLKNEVDASVQVGVSLFLCYLQKSPEQVKNQLEQFLSLSDKYQLPVMIQFDGIDYQNAYPELWNWWDPSKPGYDPDNRNNVEWTYWIPDSAVMLGWRNWGSQHRVGPMPNLASADYREVCFKQLSIFIPVVLKWWRKTGYSERFVGIQMDNEVSIGVNNFFLPGGNNYLNEPAENDPKLNLNHEIWPGFGARPIGYAAVKTMGLASSSIIREEDVARVTDNYIRDLCHFANKLGVPRNKLFTHAGGWREGQLFFYSALNEYSCPGWSFYSHAKDPQSDVTAMDALQKSDAPYWCNAETFLMGGKTEQEWIDCLNNNLKISRIRYVNIRNWRNMKDKDFIFNAVKKIQTEQK